MNKLAIFVLKWSIITGPVTYNSSHYSKINLAHYTYLPANSFSMYLACSLAAERSALASSMYSCNMLFSASSCSANACTS